MHDNKSTKCKLESVSRMQIKKKIPVVSPCEKFTLITFKIEHMVRTTQQQLSQVLQVLQLALALHGAAM